MEKWEQGQDYALLVPFLIIILITRVIIETSIYQSIVLEHWSCKYHITLIINLSKFAQVSTSQTCLTRGHIFFTAPLTYYRSSVPGTHFVKSRDAAVVCQAQILFLDNAQFPLCVYNTRRCTHVHHTRIDLSHILNITCSTIFSSSYFWSPPTNVLNFAQLYPTDTFAPVCLTPIYPIREEGICHLKEKDGQIHNTRDRTDEIKQTFIQ